VLRVWFLIAAGLTVLAASLSAQASPVDGITAIKDKVSGGTSFVRKMKFKGGERACVIAIGDHQPVVDLHLRVEDARGQLVGEDKPGGDLCCVIWYPPQDGDYTISVAVPHIEAKLDYNLLYVGVK
jgi:hypothetical protein